MGLFAVNIQPPEEGFPTERKEITPGLNTAAVAVLISSVDTGLDANGHPPPDNLVLANSAVAGSGVVFWHKRVVLTATDVDWEGEFPGSGIVYTRGPGPKWAIIDAAIDYEDNNDKYNLRLLILRDPLNLTPCMAGTFPAGTSVEPVIIEGYGGDGNNQVVPPPKGKIVKTNTLFTADTIGGASGVPQGTADYYKCDPTKEFVAEVPTDGVIDDGDSGSAAFDNEDATAGAQKCYGLLDRVSGLGQIKGVVFTRLPANILTWVQDRAKPFGIP